MIFVVVGLHGEGFNRLVEMADEIPGKTGDKVLIQIGRSSYLPRHSGFFRFKDKKSMSALYSSADIIITHGGSGSIMSSLIYGKPIIAVPRLSNLGEHNDDHQLEIVSKFSELGYILVAYNSTQLGKAINDIKNGAIRFSSYNFGKERKRIIDFLRQYLHNVGTNSF
jgi:beta-1,4-N-acetylglucosaminyltransferase